MLTVSKYSRVDYENTSKCGVKQDYLAHFR